jgi:hypothetical protein
MGEITQGKADSFYPMQIDRRKIRFTIIFAVMNTTQFVFPGIILRTPQSGVPFPGFYLAPLNLILSVLNHFSPGLSI